MVLRHTLPDGSSHFDWLIDRPGAPRVPTFRCDASPASAEAFDADRLPDHRRIYLEYEGPISGDRGRVDRVASGRVLEAALDDAAPRVRCDFGAGPVVLEGRAVPGGNRLRFARVERGI